MKILLVANYGPDKQESMLRFAELLHHELQSRDHEVQVLRPEPRFNRAEAGPSGIAKWFGYLDKFVLFPGTLKKLASTADVVHICDHSNAPYVRVLNKVAHVVTCHDVLAIRSAQTVNTKNPTKLSGKILQRYIAKGLNRARLVACVSQNTRTQLLEVTSAQPDRAKVVYNGLNYDYSPIPSDQAAEMIRSLVKKQHDTLDSSTLDLIAERGFIFHIGGNLWYKNRMGVLKIYQELCASQTANLPFLIMAGHPFTEEMQEFISSNRLERVLNLKNVSNEELRALYSSAELLLFPSWAEGFGWPIAEAQACGCRVVTTNAAPMTEVGGTAAIYCDPANEAEVARSIERLLAEETQAKQARIDLGIENAKRFSTAQMIDNYVRLYKEAILHHPRS